MSDSLQPHGLQHTRLPCPSRTPRAYSNSCPSSQWCHPTISSSVVPFSPCLQSFPASGSLLRSQFFASGGQSTGVSASTSVLPVNTQDWFSLGWTGWISLQSKELSRALSNTRAYCRIFSCISGPCQHHYPTSCDNQKCLQSRTSISPGGGGKVLPVEETQRWGKF